MKRGVLVAVLALLFLVPTTMWAASPEGVGPPSLPIDAHTVDGYHVIDIINPLQGKINAEATTRAYGDVALDSRLTSVEAYESRIAALETQLMAALDLIADLQTSIEDLGPTGELAELANYVTVNDNTINGLVGPHVIFKGVNVHINNGLDYLPSTNGSIPIQPVNGLGNLIIGLNIPPTSGAPDFIPEELGTEDRYGSHNLVLGAGNRFSSYGAIISGWANNSSHSYASIIGGARNISSGRDAVVVGGIYNEARGNYSTVVGGYSNIALANQTSILGGSFNSAEERWSTVSGGMRNNAIGIGSTVAGGDSNSAQGLGSSVAGGYGNIAYDTNEILP